MAGSTDRLTQIHAGIEARATNLLNAAFAGAPHPLSRITSAFTGGRHRAVGVATVRPDGQAPHLMHEADEAPGWIWVGRLDATSCSGCWAMHGTRHALRDPGWPGCPGCNCVRLPMWRTRTAGGIPDAEARFADLPHADQLRIMGPARLDLLRSGRIGWADLVARNDGPGRSRSYGPAPLASLWQRGKFANAAGSDAFQRGRNIRV
ncbi:hypothetical protein AB0F72_09095 [Actinoplanes sp. NPDC023936]|uniref:hypothetical protein n=1 Tax=Actinoplanes sp. NPDC023936 TaxID=3154910 RepID=UPI00340A5B80